jgi:hypothetical protein
MHGDRLDTADTDPADPVENQSHAMRHASRGFFYDPQAEGWHGCMSDQADLPASIRDLSRDFPKNQSDVHLICHDCA